MGRKPSINLNLPEGMRIKRGSKGQTWYYLEKPKQPDGSRPWLSLGDNLPDALRNYANLLETRTAPPFTVKELLERWSKVTAPGRALGTLDDIRYSLPKLIAFFNDPPAPLSAIKPVHIRQYLDWRKITRANREIAWLSAAWNWARDRGLTEAQNPTLGIKRHKEKGRDIYIEDDELTMILAQADEPLREAMQLAYLIGQRPGDLRDISEHDIRSGFILIEQNKTGAKLRIEIIGRLAELIEQIKTRKASIKYACSPSLICNEKGQALGKAAMRYRFDKARKRAVEKAPTAAIANRLRTIQFRDLRAKAASDLEALDKAQSLLGHTTRNTTERYVRTKRGEKVQPVK
jgi:integrase